MISNRPMATWGAQVTLEVEECLPKVDKIVLIYNL